MSRNTKRGKKRVEGDLQEETEQPPAQPEAEEGPDVARVARDAELDRVRREDERQGDQDADHERVGDGPAVGQGFLVQHGESVLHAQHVELLVQADDQVEDAHDHSGDVDGVGLGVPHEEGDARDAREQGDDELEGDHAVPLAEGRAVEHEEGPAGQEEHDVGEEGEADHVGLADVAAGPGAPDLPEVPAPVDPARHPLAQTR